MGGGKIIFFNNACVLKTGDFFLWSFVFLTNNDYLNSLVITNTRQLQNTIENH